MPTALRVLHGETRPSRINRHEPRPRSGKPSAPTWLSPSARVIWRKTLRELQPMGIVTPADTNALGLYCMALAEYIAAAAIVAEKGLLVDGRHSGLVANPAARIERDRFAMACRLGEEFGLTPSARVTLGTTPAMDDPAIEALLS